MRHLLPALLVLMAASGCGAASVEDAQEELNAYARRSDLRYSRDFQEADPARGLRIVCSRGQLCGELSPRVWVYEDEQVRFRLTFTPSTTGGEDRYRAAWSLGPLDGLSVPGWSFTTVSEDAPALGTFTSEGGWLQGRLDTVSTVIQGLKDDPEACTDANPDDRNWPRGCFVNAATELPLHLTFRLPLETGEVDCRGTTPPSRCN